jgi:hypothetical protein
MSAMSSDQLNNIDAYISTNMNIVHDCIHNYGNNISM